MLTLVPRVTLVVVFLLVASACASVSEGESVESRSIATTTSPTIDAVDALGRALPGDGTLDCPEGQIVRGGGIDVSAGTEVLVVAKALEQWTSEGAIVVDLSPEEFWSAVLDGSDVAIALPELNGDGTWVVHDVQTCGEPKTGPAGIDGELDCASESSWAMQGSIDPTKPGLPGAEEAVRSSLDWYAERYGGEIVIVSEGVASLVVDQREQVVARAVEVSAGGWVVTTLLGCNGFEFVR